MAARQFNEPRVIKPGFESKKILDNIEWRLFEKDLWTKEDVIVVEELEQNINPSIKIYLNNDAIVEENINKEDFSLSIIYEHTVLKESIQIYSNVLKDVQDEVFETPFALHEKIYWDNNSSIHFVVYSNKDQKENNLRYGQIISKKIFNIKYSSDSINLFDPIPLKPEEFEQRGYSKNTAFIPVVDTTSLSESFEECVNVIQILIAKDLTEADNISAINHMILNSTIEEILITGWNEFEYDDLDDESILKNITLRVAKKANIKEPQKIAQIVKQKKYPLLKAYIQHAFDFKKQLKGIIEK